MSARSARSELALALLGELSGSSEPTPDDRLEDLGIDSLGLAELAIAIERGFGVDLADARAFDGVSTVGDVLSTIDGLPPQPREGSRPGTGWLQWIVGATFGWGLRWWFPLGIEGASNVPRSGPAVIAMNHESALDVPLIVVSCPRRIVFMAKKELFKNAFLSWWLRALGGFRVDRDRFDLRAVRVAISALRSGKVLGMYPEGTRSPGELLPFLDGAAWTALLTGAPIVPCAISGTERTRDARRPGVVTVRVSFAPQIDVDRVDDPVERRARAAALTAEVRSAIERRLDGRAG
ncbi:MAG TPA: 1-acyl-sn-glycerol-3-phosphate acyltransferase [Actinomycetota bacterium]|nr:1-acyl-sn-glycerol-3-phosphate acyltransferase [Actinomycetota bacterium]